MGIKSKILTPAIALIIIVAVAVLVSNIVLFEDFVEKSTLVQVDTATKVAVSNLNFLKAEAKSASLSIAKDDIIIRALTNNNRDELMVRARSLANEAGIEFCTITDTSGNVIVRTHEPEMYGDSIAYQTNVKAAIYGETMTVIEAGNVVRLSVRSSTSIIGNDGSIIGVLSAGYRLDTHQFVDSVKALTGCELSIVLGDTRVSTTVQQEDGTRAVGTKADPVILKTVLGGNPYSGKIDILGRATFCNYVPIIGADGSAIGMIFIGQYLDEGRETIIAFIKSGLIIMLLMLGVAIAVILMVVGRIVKKEYERIRLMLDAMPMASRIWSKELKLIECNKEAVKLFHIANKKEYIDQYFDWMPEYQPDGQKSKDKALALIQEAFDKGRAKGKLTYNMPDGSIMPTELILVRIPFGDDDVVAAYTHDLREQLAMTAELEQALAQAKDASNAKSDFLAKMSHEMRTPLNAIIGLSEIALGCEELELETKSNIEKIYNAGTTLLSIVNDILDISKIQSGKFIITPCEYDVPSLLNDAMLQNVLRIGSRPIHFILNIDKNVPARLYGDELRIKQIINNLLSNAFKYTEQGDVELGFSCEHGQDNNVHVTICVRDSGIGIRAENLRHIFDDYEQFGVTSKERVGGTGLGLAIAKKLTELMGGTLNAESIYGKGSEFIVKLCQGYVNDTVLGETVVKDLKSLQYSASKLNRNTHKKRIQLTYARILLVDDNKTNLDVGRGLMKPYGMQIDCVTSGQEAIDAMREAKVKYNAIFMDHMMPNMDGIEATQLIREIGSEYTNTIPIIALTANAVVGNEEMFLSKGFQAFLSKPVNMEKLDQIINSWVRNKVIEEELSYISNTQEEQATLPTVYGIDIVEALERFGGDRDTLMDVFSSYVTNTPPLLSQLRASVDTKNYADYATIVHGLKGASYSISANEVGKLAELLEGAAKSGDIDGVSVLHTTLETLTETLLHNINTLLNNIGTVIAPISTKNYHYFTAPNAKILLVEDNETSRKSVIGQLKPLKMHIDTANNGKEALALLDHERYHLILLDYMMPIMDGMETITILRQREGEYYHKVPVIALTAHDGIKEQFLQAGINDFLKKPVEMTEICEKIKHWLPADLLYEQDSAWVSLAEQDSLPIIEGINSQDGIRYSGTKELFISLLGDFYKLIDIKANKLNQYLADDMLRDLAIEAHALRNTSRMIGATELSEAFSRLEQYGNDRNREALESAMPKVMQQYRSFKPLLKSFGEVTEQRKKSIPNNEIISLLQELIAAIDTFDTDHADIIFRQLADVQLPTECRSQMEALSAYMADVAMEDIMKSAETMIELLSKEII
jgi:signal transduction histidine kinase/DNA-binding response OmpR family regulator/HPt (histidine-containing phosphotransfer) domain-containing protein